MLFLKVDLIMHNLAILAHSIKLGARAFVHEWTRNLFGILILGVGTFTIVTFVAYLDRVYWGIAETTIHSQTGHIQIAVEGYEGEKTVAEYELMLTDWQAIRDEVIALGVNLEFITPRLEFSGLIGNGDEKTAVFVGVGVDPEIDHRVSSFEKIERGYPLTAKDSDLARILIGDVLLDALDLDVGDRALILGVGPDGGLNALDVDIKGSMLSDSPAYNERYLKLPFNMAQALLQTEAASKLVILLHETGETDKVADTLRAHFAKTGRVLEVNTWRDLNLAFDKIKATYGRMFRFLGSSVAFLVVVTLINLTIINFIERRDQVVILIVKGFSRTRIAMIFAVENLLIAIMGATVGIIAFLALFSIVNAFGGLRLSPPPGSVKDVIFKLILPLEALPWLYFAVIMFAMLASCFCGLSIYRITVSEYIRRV